MAINNVQSPEDTVEDQTPSTIPNKVVLTPRVRLNLIEAYANKTYGK
jgi:hypothetical protein